MSTTAMEYGPFRPSKASLKARRDGNVVNSSWYASRYEFSMTAVARIAAEAAQNAVDTRATGAHATAKENALRDHKRALSKGLRFRRKRTTRKTMAPAITTIATRGNGTGTDKPRTRVEAPQKTASVSDWTKRKRA